jgi:ubiquinone/menaquinone biosynthesis C-methylase UbiE
MDEFQEKALSYDQIGGVRGMNEDCARALVDLCHLQSANPVERILDVGCGTGKFSFVAFPLLTTARWCKYVTHRVCQAHCWS